MRIWRGEDEPAEDYEHPEKPAAVIEVNSLIPGRPRHIRRPRQPKSKDITKTWKKRFRWIVVGDDSGEVRVTFRPGHGDDIQTRPRSCRVTGKASQSGNKQVAMDDPTYAVIETPRGALGRRQ